MKRNILILLISIAVQSMAVAQSIDDDIYFKPSDAKKQASTVKQPSKTNNNYKPNYKNGAKEIVFVDRDSTNLKDSLNLPGDSLLLVQMNDSIANEEQGYYLNGFNGTENDREYAERIRKFHNPKYAIFPNV